jgi:hypothetical protein
MRRRCRSFWKLGLGLALAAGGGCQTWVPEAGLTLPSPHYLEHPGQYIPPSPPFPLPREEAALEAAAAAQVPGRLAPAVAPLPPAPLAPP